MHCKSWDWGDRIWQRTNQYCAISGFDTFSGVKISLEENFYDNVYKYNFYLRLLGLPLLRYNRYSKALHSLYCIRNRLYKLLRVVTNSKGVVVFSLALSLQQQPQASARPATLLLLPSSSHSSFCFFLFQCKQSRCLKNSYASLVGIILFRKKFSVHTIEKNNNFFKIPSLYLWNETFSILLRPGVRSL